MIDQDELNVRWLESAKENFDEALAARDWKTCRLILVDMTENGFGSKTYELRRQMNALMGSYTPMDSETVDRNITNFHD